MANKFDDLVDQDDSLNHGNGTNIDKPTTPEDVERETYTEEELRDVNAISVTIPDQNTPIVVFFGSQASGKTLALMRMIRFWEANQHTVIAEEVFRPKTDKHYSRMCQELKSMVYSEYTPGGTDVISFMLVKVLNPVGQPICQILEAPGEHYFDGTSNIDFPRYINAISTTPNRKVWVFFVEQGWGQTQSDRNLYAQKICSMQGLISPNDKVVFLFNKADKQRKNGQYDRTGKPRKQLFFDQIKREYPGIFTRYQNSGLTKFLYGEYNFKVVCFSAGKFNRTNDGKEVWTPEIDWYCSEFWDAIK
ncbi:MAG: hypothetical protein HDT07_05735 [Bacteroidales bacterium]|nr:hypothetical protein [Bacteroidales bacterium]